MPSKKYSLQEGEPERLEISWKGLWKNLTVRVDGRVVGTVADSKALQFEDNVFALPDGSQLRVALKKGFLNAGLSVTRDGQAVPGSFEDPQAIIKAAYGVIFFLCGMNLLVGLLAFFMDSPILEQLGAGWASFAVATVYGVLGTLVATRRSRIALGVAIGLYGFDFFGGFILNVLDGRTRRGRGILRSSRFHRLDGARVQRHRTGSTRRRVVSNTDQRLSLTRFAIQALALANPPRTTLRGLEALNSAGGGI